MLMCPECGNPLDDGGFTNCSRTRGNECSRDRGSFQQRVEDIKATLGLDALAKMEQNLMPECFSPTRESAVALAQLLMQALRQNQELYQAVRKQ